MDGDVRQMLRNLQRVSQFDLFSLLFQDVDADDPLDNLFAAAWDKNAIYELVEEAPDVKQVLVEFGFVFESAPELACDEAKNSCVLK
jgi:hypothetical protein